jgi:S1-C subfamily serine protease
VWDDTPAVNLLDVALTALIVLAAYGGYRRGALLQLLAYGGLLVGAAVGALLAPLAAHRVDAPAAQAGIAVGTLLVCAGLGDVLGWFIGGHLRARTQRTLFRVPDSMAGAIVSVAALLVFVWFVGLNLVNGPLPSLARQIRGSAIVRTLGEALPEPPSLLAEARRFLDRFGFPEVFAGLPPAPSGPVGAPTQAQAQRAFEAADQSTVRIVGEACGQIQEGSGFVVAPGYVVTNAHVVAGEREPKIQRQGAASQSNSATVVAFDPRMDLAVLYVAASPGPPLELVAGTVDRGAKGAVLGYPGGGPLTGDRAAVRDRIPAVGRDIYGQGTVDRDVYELQAVVRPGNSGGPFVLVDGRVAGVVFAASTLDENVGYAIASMEVMPVVERALGRTGSVPTGDCVR